MINDDSLVKYQLVKSCNYSNVDRLKYSAPIACGYLGQDGLVR